MVRQVLMWNLVLSYDKKYDGISENSSLELNLRSIQNQFDL